MDAVRGNHVAMTTFLIHEYEVGTQHMHTQHMHTHAHARTHTHTRTHMHTHTHHHHNEVMASSDVYHMMTGTRGISEL